MGKKRIISVVAALTAGALGMSACAAPEVQSNLNEETTLVAMYNEYMYSMNSLTSYGNNMTNVNLVYLTRDNFVYYDEDLNLQANPSYGTYEKVSDNPLKVKLTYADTAKWSDGTPVDAADAVLAWGSQSGVFNNVPSEQLADMYNDDYTMKETADGQVYFDTQIYGIDWITEFPEVSADLKSVTFTYSKPFADWEAYMLYFGMGLPAHIVGKRALGVEDATAAKAAVIAAFQNKDNSALSKIANSYNSDWNFTSTPSDPDLLVGSGAFVITEIKAKEYATMKPNEKYEGDHKAPVDVFTLRYNEDPMAHVQALENKEVQIIYPMPTADVLSAVQKLSDVEVFTDPEGTFEHVDLTFDNGGPFDPATYGGDAAKALKVRQAFLKTIPRQTIVDSIIEPLNPDATVRNSYNIVPGAPMYDSAVASNGMAEQYGEVDIEAAKSLLAEAGVKTATVRVLYSATNPRRQQEFKLIKESAEKAGFEIIDGGDEGWGGALGGGTYDASIYGWASTTTGITETASYYVEGGMNNYSGYKNSTIEQLEDQIGTSLDPAEWESLNNQIEKLLVDDAYGLTLYQFPGLTAYDTSAVSGVNPIALSPTFLWNFWQWEIL
ncbi:MAG: ABC transporter family substrate-binding protein [Propionibacteriaceae bacterium]|jgi:peptide/nickel transport system substrate-binding protein|nr:ABC transporter family substrate-binding protein [Propionibacteriaceae bacterium]